jgi:hypothetical protein
MTGYESKRAAAQDKLDEDAIIIQYHEATIKRLEKRIEELMAQPAQEPVAWLEPEWGEKICPEVGYEVTMTDDHPKDLGWTPLYAHPPQGEIVAYLVLFEGAGKLLEFKKGNYIHGAKVEHVPLYTTPSQRTWVGLTNEDKQELDEKYGDDYLAHLDAVEAKLKEKNNG